MSKLIMVTAPHFVAGVIVGKRAAPIIRYMKYWSEEKIAEYCAMKGWFANTEPNLLTQNKVAKRGAGGSKKTKHAKLYQAVLDMAPSSVIEWTQPCTSIRGLIATISDFKLPFKVYTRKENNRFFIVRCI
jgi:hypothetical protein